MKGWNALNKKRCAFFSCLYCEGSEINMAIANFIVMMMVMDDLNIV